MELFGMQGCSMKTVFNFNQRHKTINYSKIFIIKRFVAGIKLFDWPRSRDEQMLQDGFDPWVEQKSASNFSNIGQI